MSDLDLASIGVTFDTTGLRAGQQAFQQTEQAANNTANAVDRSAQAFTSASQRTTAAAQSMGSANDRVKQSLVGVSSAADKLTMGQIQLIEKMQEQARTIGMSQSQLLEYQAAQMGVTAQTRSAIEAIKAHEEAIRAE